MNKSASSQIVLLMAAALVMSCGIDDEPMSNNNSPPSASPTHSPGSRHAASWAPAPKLMSRAAWRPSAATAIALGRR